MAIKWRKTVHPAQVLSKFPHQYRNSAVISTVVLLCSSALAVNAGVCAGSSEELPTATSVRVH